MILAVAVLAGLAAGLLRAKRAKTAWRSPALRNLWLVPAFFLPQFLAFGLPGTRNLMADSLAAVSLVTSLIGLMVFCLLNWKLPGMPVLSIGLLLNLIVITANAGFMPLSTQTAAALFPKQAQSSLDVGSRIGLSKDILLAPERIVFPWLADRFMPPDWFPYQFAFSLGDVFIGIGAYLLLATPSQSGSFSRERTL